MSTPDPQVSLETGQPSGVRLQKVLADAGIGSRRVCEDLIARGRVTVNRTVTAHLGMRVDPERDVIHVEGKLVPTRAGVVYLALNKPRGVVSAMADERGAPTLADLVPAEAGRVFHVGRLDQDTEGLLLLTNDGDLAHRLTHPSFGVEKTYVAQVRGRVTRAVERRLSAGVAVDDRIVDVHQFRVVQAQPEASLVEIVIHEGRKHIVRRLLDAVGHPVTHLARTAFGPVRLGALRPGETRPLSRDEVQALYAAVDL